MLPTGVFLVCILSLGVEVYSQSSNTLNSKPTGTTVCSDSQAVSDWILEAPARLKSNEKSFNKTAESAMHHDEHENVNPNRRNRIVLMKFRGRRGRRARALKIAPESEYRFDLINKFVKNVEVLFLAHYPNRSQCGMGTFSSYSSNKTDNIKRKDDCFWSIESSLQFKDREQFKYTTPKCGCFNFSFYIAYKPGDETVIERPDPQSIDPFKKQSKTYCISEEGISGFKRKHKRKKDRRRGGKKARKHGKKAKKEWKRLARSRKDVGLQTKYAGLLYPELSPPTYRQIHFRDIESVPAEIRTDENENSIKHYEYFTSGGFTENSEDDGHDGSDEYEGEIQEIDENEGKVVSDDESEEEDEEVEQNGEKEELEVRLNEGESGESSEEKEKLGVRLNEGESGESSEEKEKLGVGLYEGESGELNEEDNRVSKKMEEHDDESSDEEEEKEYEKKEYKDEENDSCESDESEESDEDEKENDKRVTEARLRERKNKSEISESKEEDNDSDETGKRRRIIYRRRDNYEGIGNDHRRIRPFRLRMEDRRRRRIFNQRLRRPQNKRASFKATKICCNQGIFRKKMVLHNTLENIVEFTETCDDIPVAMTTRISRSFHVTQEFCGERFRQCCHTWSLFSPKMRMQHIRHPQF